MRLRTQTLPGVRVRAHHIRNKRKHQDIEDMTPAGITPLLPAKQERGRRWKGGRGDETKDEKQEAHRRGNMHGDREKRARTSRSPSAPGFVCRSTHSHTGCDVSGCRSSALVRFLRQVPSPRHLDGSVLLCSLAVDFWHLAPAGTFCPFGLLSLVFSLYLLRSAREKKLDPWLAGRKWPSKRFNRSWRTPREWVLAGVDPGLVPHLPGAS